MTTEANNAPEDSGATPNPKDARALVEEIIRELKLQDKLEVRERREADERDYDEFDPTPEEAKIARGVSVSTLVMPEGSRVVPIPIGTIGRVNGYRRRANEPLLYRVAFPLPLVDSDGATWQEWDDRKTIAVYFYFEELKELTEQPVMERLREYELADGGCLEAPDAGDNMKIRRRDLHGNLEEWREPGDEGYEEWRSLFPFAVTEALSSFFGVEIRNEQEGGESPATLASARGSWLQAPADVRLKWCALEEGEEDTLEEVETELRELLQIHPETRPLAAFV